MSSSRARRVLAGLLALATCILLLVSTLAVWAGRTVLNTDRFTAAVDASLSDPVVLDALSAWVADQTAMAIEESGVVERLVPDDWTIVGAVVERALIRLATEETDRLVRSDRVHDLIVGGTRRSHAAALRVLEGEVPQGGLVVAHDGTVDLNLLPVVALSVERAQGLGLLPGVELPELTRDMTVAEQNAALGDALGVELRDDLGQLTIYERDAGSSTSIVRTAQRALTLFRTSVVLIVVATILSGVLALLVAPNRLHIAAWLAGGALAVALLTGTIVDAVAAAVPQVVTDPDARAAARVIVDNVVGNLEHTVAVLALTSTVLVLVILGWSWLVRHPDQRERVGALAVTYADAIRAAALAAAVLVLVVLGLGWLSLIAAVIVGVGIWSLPTVLPLVTVDSDQEPSPEVADG